jgi:hypothetical protein
MVIFKTNSFDKNMQFYDYAKIMAGEEDNAYNPNFLNDYKEISKNL